MTKNLLSLFRCPFCTEGQVFIDPRAVTKHLAANDDHFFVREQPDQRVFRFRPAHETDQPCPHLFLMSGTFARRKSEVRDATAKGIDFDWLHPRMKEIRENEQAEYAYWEGVMLAPENAVRPDTKYVHEFFERLWTRRTRNNQVRHYEVSGHFLSVESVYAFLTELPSFAVKLGDWMHQAAS